MIVVATVPSAFFSARTRTGPIVGNDMNQGTDEAPMGTITMDGEDGAPRVTENMCMRCGQCAYVCPMEARKLSLRPEEELLLPLPETVADDWNAKAAFRFEQGFIF